MGEGIKMTMSWNISLLVVVVLCTSIPKAASLDIGVCYGMLGNNLPPAAAVVGLYQKYGIEKMRLFNPDPAALNALRGSNISVVLGVANEDLPSIAASQAAADSWFAAHVGPYVNDIVFSIISAGNEVVPGQFSTYVRPAMDNLQNVLTANNLQGVRVSTVVSTATLSTSYPPSAAAFSDAASADMGNIVAFLSAHGSPLLINLYPYFAYAGEPDVVPLAYAQFTATAPVVRDGELSYTNLLDAMTDAFLWAMEKAGSSDLDVIVSESGWPSAGNGTSFTTPELAAGYNRNFMKHVLGMKGTPKKPGAYIEGYIFAMFNENLKPAGVEQNFGLFNPDMTPVQNIFNP